MGSFDCARKYPFGPFGLSLCETQLPNALLLQLIDAWNRWGLLLDQAEMRSLTACQLDIFFSIEFQKMRLNFPMKLLKFKQISFIET